MPLPMPPTTIVRTPFVTVLGRNSLLFTTDAQTKINYVSVYQQA